MTKLFKYKGRKSTLSGLCRFNGVSYKDAISEKQKAMKIGKLSSQDAVEVALYRLMERAARSLEGLRRG